MFAYPCSPDRLGVDVTALGRCGNTGPAVCLDIKLSYESFVVVLRGLPVGV
jgi:hypothetical protein